jgi:hypothetical protein
MQNIELDRNYKVLLSNKNESYFYQDEIDLLIDRVMYLKEQGKITDSTATRMIKIYLSRYLVQEVKSGLQDVYLEDNGNSKRSAKMLFFKWINKTTYA